MDAILETVLTRQMAEKGSRTFKMMFRVKSKVIHQTDFVFLTWIDCGKLEFFLTIFLAKLQFFCDFLHLLRENENEEDHPLSLVPRE